MSDYVFYTKKPSTVHRATLGRAGILSLSLPLLDYLGYPSRVAIAWSHEEQTLTIQAVPANEPAVITFPVIRHKHSATIPIRPALREFHAEVGAKATWENPRLAGDVIYLPFYEASGEGD
jgi:hypothetical protein